MLMKLDVNGRRIEIDAEADATLLEVLREHGFKSVKCGCDTGNCGACTVLVDGRPRLGCSTLAARAQGHEVTTLEGAGPRAECLAACLASEGAEQCGFCSPGLIMTVLAMEDELCADGAAPADDEIDRYLAGNLCRCTGYMSQRRGIARYLAAAAAERAGASEEDAR